MHWSSVRKGGSNSLSRLQDFIGCWDLPGVEGAIAEYFNRNIRMAADALSMLIEAAVRACLCLGER